MEKNIMSFEEAVEYTGFSKSYLYKLTSGRKIPHYKPTGRKLFFKRDELDTWLLSNPVKTDARLETEAATYIATNKQKIAFKHLPLISSPPVAPGSGNHTFVATGVPSRQ